MEGELLRPFRPLDRHLCTQGIGLRPQPWAGFFRPFRPWRQVHPALFSPSRVPRSRMRELKQTRGRPRERCDVRRDFSSLLVIDHEAALVSPGNQQHAKSFGTTNSRTLIVRHAGERGAGGFGQEGKILSFVRASRGDGYRGRHEVRGGLQGRVGARRRHESGDAKRQDQPSDSFPSGHGNLPVAASGPETFGGGVRDIYELGCFARRPASRGIPPGSVGGPLAALPSMRENDLRSRASL